MSLLVLYKAENGIVTTDHNKYVEFSNGQNEISKNMFTFKLITRQSVNPVFPRPKLNLKNHAYIQINNTTIPNPIRSVPRYAPDINAG